MDDIDWDRVTRIVSKKQVPLVIKRESKTVAPEHDLYMYNSKRNNVGKLILQRDGIHIKFKNHDSGRLRSLHSWFTIKTKLGFKKMFKMITAYKFNSETNEVCLPRFGLFERLASTKNMETIQLANPIVENTLDECDLKYDTEEDYELDGELSHNQKITIKWLMGNVYTNKKINRGIAGCIVQMPTGTGKTFLGAGMIAECKVTTLVVCRDSGDCAQWVKTLETVFPNASIGEYHSKRKVDGDVIVAVFKSVAEVETFEYSHPTRSIKYSKSGEKFFRKFGLIIWDECHDYCTKIGLKAYQRAQAPRMMGLTATPHDRPDKFNKVSEWYLGPVINAMNIAGYETDETMYKCHVKAILYKGPVDYTKPVLNKTTGQISTTGMIQQLIEDPYRLRVICEYISDLYDKGKNTVVFADRKSYLDIILRALAKFPEIAADSKIITGGAKTEELENIQETRVILTTYAYFGTGKSVKNLNAIIFATPRKSHTMQFIGRIFRKNSDNTIRRYIIDLVDKNTSLSRQFYNRKKIYDIQDSLNRKFKLEKITIDFSDVRFESNSRKLTKSELMNVIKDITEK